MFLVSFYNSSIFHGQKPYFLQKEQIKIKIGLNESFFVRRRKTSGVRLHEVERGGTPQSRPEKEKAPEGVRWWEVRDSFFFVFRQQIYSLLHLATLETSHE